jgi:Flp pilus assembly protein TadB
MSPIMIALAFFAGFFLIFAINYALADVADAHRHRYRKRLEEELQRRQKELARVSIADRDLQAVTAAGMAELLPRRSLKERLVSLMNESGVAMRLDQLLVACAAMGFLAFLPCAFLGQHWLMGALLGLAASPLPLAYVVFLRKQRREKILNQLPDAFELMSRTLRAGQTMNQAFQAVADEAAPPISEEFGFCYEQQNLGLAAEGAMRDLAQRTGLLGTEDFRHGRHDPSANRRKHVGVARQVEPGNPRPSQDPRLGQGADGRGGDAGVHLDGTAAGDAGGHVDHESPLRTDAVRVLLAVGRGGDIDVLGLAVDAAHYQL